MSWNGKRMSWEEKAHKFQRSAIKDEKEVSDAYSYSSNQVEQAIVHTRQDLVLVVYLLKRLNKLLFAILFVLTLIFIVLLR